MKIKTIFGVLFCFLFAACSNFHSNPSQYFSEFIKDNTKSVNQNISNTESSDEKTELLSNLDFYFRILNVPNVDSMQYAKQITREQIIPIENKVSFTPTDKIELYKITDRYSDSTVLDNELDIISVSVFLDSSLIKKYEHNQPVSFLELMPEQTYTLVVTFNYARIIQEAKFYIYLNNK